LADHKTGSKRCYDRFCPLSLALDQVGERWTLHVVLALMSGPKRYSQLKRHLSGAGANILSDRLRGLAANHLVGRSTADSPGSEVTYHLTERGRALAPVVGSLSMWGLSLLMPAPEDDDPHTVFDQTWTPPAAAGPTDETYRWRIDDVEFELTARNGELIRTRGRATRPAVIFQTTSSTLGDIVRGQITVTDAVQQGDASMKGSRSAVRRMFATIGFPLARLGF
jgi:DNA-binding HxlR family transcriptional regulator